MNKESKQALLDKKEQLLEDIHYYENKILKLKDDLRLKTYFDKESSDSEEDFPTFNTGPGLSQLESQQSSLEICVHATQELTGVTVLQSQVNVLVTPPEIEREPPILEEGTWREVNAECRVDLIPFSVTFYIFQSQKKFAPLLYRGLKVLPVKAAHEVELSKSVLPAAKTPCDAVEVLRNYADAYRSRRSTLAQLADEYANNLYMEPLADGGYLLKCANLLELSWRLENKKSPLASFQHRLTFDLEYMEEAYLKIISQAHKQLSDPTISTETRTLLLSKILSTCLAARGQDVNGSIDSDTNRRIEKNSDDQDHVLNQNADKNDQNDESASDVLETSKTNVLEGSKAKDLEVMAPPKSLPKKIKSKAAGNSIDNKKSVKRGIVDQDKIVNKKAKIAENRKEVSKSTNIVASNQTSKATEKGTNVASTENKEKMVTNKTKSVANKINSVKNVASNKGDGVKPKNSHEKIDANVKNKTKEPKSATSEGNKDVAEKIKNKAKANEKVASVKNKENIDKNKPKDNNTDAKKVIKNNVASKNLLKVNTKEKTVKNAANAKTVTENTKQIAEKNIASVKNSKDPKAKNPQTKTTSNDSDPKNKNINSTITIEKERTQKDIKNTTVTLIKSRFPEKTTRNSKTPPNSKNSNPLQISKKITKPTSKNTVKILKNVANTKEKAKIADITKKIIIKSHKSGIKAGNTDLRVSKIPQIRLTATSDSNLLKKPLRNSPRIAQPKFKSTSDTNMIKKLTKPLTSIPILKKS